MRFLFLIFLAMIVSSCSGGPFLATPSASQKFNNYMDQVFEESMQLSPEGLTYFGRKEKYGQLDDRSEAFEQKMFERAKKHLEDLKQFNYQDLDAQTKLTYDLFKKDNENFITDFQWRDYGYSINQQYGVHSNLPSFMMNMHRVDNEQDLKDYISRLNQFRRVFSEVESAIDRSEKVGVVPPKFVFPYVYKTSQNILSGAPFEKSQKDSPLYADFKAKMQKLNLSETKKKEYMAQVDAAMSTSVQPAYDSLLKRLKKLEKVATNDDGIWKVPRGAEYYSTRLERVTTTKMKADQIHKLGLENVARLRKDMMALQAKLKIKGSLQDFFKTIRNDKNQYFASTPEGRQGYLAMTNQFYSDINKKVPDYFRLLPKAPMEIKAVEEFRQESAGKAFYEGPSDDGTRPGVFYANLKDMKDQPKFEAEALFYHEGVPGHHFQIALGMELKNLPKYRRYNGYTAFVEGWALYAERLGKEMGGYKDDYAELGRLSMEMVRACRLVVDTGIHSKKWTRKKAINYLNDNLPVAAGMQIEQIERYIVWPGQATGYMVGMLKIVELREKAQKELGAKFDVRDFHAVVLENGSVPLDVLEKLVSDYIAQKKG